MARPPTASAALETFWRSGRFWVCSARFLRAAPRESETFRDCRDIHPAAPMSDDPIRPHASRRATLGRASASGGASGGALRQIGHFRTFPDFPAERHLITPPPGGETLEFSCQRTRGPFPTPTVRDQARTRARQFERRGESPEKGGGKILRDARIVLTPFARIRTRARKWSYVAWGAECGGPSVLPDRWVAPRDRARRPECVCRTRWSER